MHRIIVSHFKDNDSKMYELAIKYPKALIITKKPTSAYLSELCESIVSQQLSVKAASTIWGRTHSIVNDWNSPYQVVDATHEALRAAGLSNQKISYVKNIAEAIKSGELVFDKFDNLNDFDIISELTMIKGIGKWTAEMFLIFTMGRPDVFSAGDLGLRNAIKKNYGLSGRPDELDIFAKQWQPYRSYACKLLWASLDNV